ncbi:MAG TPA: glycine oxidase ThiO [Mycobacteriales bacterium]|nr:glycine oxidase ThiO [Mycobacteriales bacterium]
MTPAQPVHDVVVVGGGVIGLAVAWRAATEGLRVALVDPRPGSGATRVAAGMLAPVTEARYGEQPLLALALASARRYPSFAVELAEAAGRPAGYRQTGTLAVALDVDDRAALRELHAVQTGLGLATDWLTGRECRTLEPLLAPSVTGGLLAPGDHQVDNRVFAAALLAAADRAGVDLWRVRATGILCAGDRVIGVRLDDDGVLAAGQVVLAAGCWSAGLAGLPEPAVPPVRPVKGQILRLRTPPGQPYLGRAVRGTVRGGHVYLVPRPDGELVVGATVEEQGFDTRVTAGGVYELLRDAHDVLPGLTELTLVETAAGLRPGTPDNAPILGPAPVPGLVYATGHHRNGLLLTPVTADAVTAYLCTGTLPAVAAPFTLDRFAHQEVPA